ncbi:MAG: hypothetical protein ACHP84_07515 [Caulobacterales bacterium]
MWPWIYRIIAFLLALLGTSLIALVWKAVYAAGHQAETLVFRLGLPLVLLSTLAGASMLIAAGLLFTAASHRRLGDR